MDGDVSRHGDAITGTSHGMGRKKRTRGCGVKARCSGVMSVGVDLGRKASSMHA